MSRNFFFRFYLDLGKTALTLSDLDLVWPWPLLSSEYHHPIWLLSTPAAREQSPRLREERCPAEEERGNAQSLAASKMSHPRWLPLHQPLRCKTSPHPCFVKTEKRKNKKQRQVLNLSLKNDLFIIDPGSLVSQIHLCVLGRLNNIY